MARTSSSIRKNGGVETAIALSSDETLLVTANEHSKTLTFVESAAESTLAEYQLPGQPAGLGFLNSNQLAVADVENSCVLLIDVSPFPRIVKRLTWPQPCSQRHTGVAFKDPHGERRMLFGVAVEE